MRQYVAVWRKAFTFSGRASRAEYWSFFFINLALGFVLLFLAGAFSESPLVALAGLYVLASTLPSFTVGVRRMHDSNHSGFWLFVPIAGLVLLFRGSDPESNRFGPPPE
jgi:uncharacterized membrane protein YhaH (DUF805 family)